MIPPTGDISPEAMVVCLAMFPKLEGCTIEFESGIPSPDRVSPPPATQNVLLTLTLIFRVQTSIWRTSSLKSTALNGSGFGLST